MKIANHQQKNSKLTKRIFSLLYNHCVIYFEENQLEELPYE